jgi:hypothetical protein
MDESAAVVKRQARDAAAAEAAALKSAASAARRKVKYHQAREYRRLLRPQKDLRAFFGPLVGVVALAGVLSLGVVTRYTVGREGVLPEFETSAVLRPPHALQSARLTPTPGPPCAPRPLCALPAAPSSRASSPCPPPSQCCRHGAPQGNPNYSLLHTEDTYWNLASSMGGFPIKHFYKGGRSVVPNSDGQKLRAVEEGVGAGAGGGGLAPLRTWCGAQPSQGGGWCGDLHSQGGSGRSEKAHRHSWWNTPIPLYGKGLRTADLGSRQHTWLSRRVSKMREYFNVGGGSTPRHAEGVKLAQFGGPARAKMLVRDKLRQLQNHIEAEALAPRPASRASALSRGLVVTHSLPARP